MVKVSLHFIARRLKYRFNTRQVD
uniref:Uncharacterized protein n=1 Tax=Anguilla anguilla TaxID=7936 RepID=A0A0E9PHT4_ANGAN